MAMAKHNTRYDKTFFKAVLAGIMLSFGGLFNLILSGGSGGIEATNPGLVKVMSGFIFPVGLVMILLQGLELLTSNLMVFPMAVMKRAVPWWGLPANWLTVFFGNLVGSLFFAAVLAKADGAITSQPYLGYVQSFVIEKAVTPTWGQILLRGIGCNWLVCVAVWQATAAKETASKILAMWVPIWVFVACSFDHVIANMFSLSLGIMLDADLTPAEYIRKSMIASFIGNVIGGLCVAVPGVYFYLGGWQPGGRHGAESEEASETILENGKGLTHIA